MNTFKIARVSVGMDGVDLARMFVRTKTSNVPDLRLPANVNRSDTHTSDLLFRVRAMSTGGGV